MQALESFDQVVVSEGLREFEVTGRSERLAGDDRDFGIGEELLASFAPVVALPGQRASAGPRDKRRGPRGDGQRMLLIVLSIDTAMSLRR
jgi:hypothetical protein